MNPKGFIPYIVAMATVGVIVVGAITYVAITHSGSNTSVMSSINGKLSAEDQEIAANADSILKQYQSVVAHKVSHSNTHLMDKFAKVTIEEARTQIRAVAKEILAKDPCDAVLSDVAIALDTAGQAQLTMMDDLADQLISWAKEAYRSLLPDAVGEIGPTSEDRGVTIDELIHLINVERGQRGFDTVNRDINILIARGMLASLANMLGYEDFTNDIWLLDKPIPPICIQVFQIHLSARYNYKDEYGSYAEKWIMRADFNDVPLYRNESSRGLPTLHFTKTVLSESALVDIWNSAMGTKSMGKLVGAGEWKISLEIEKANNYLMDQIVATIKGNLSQFATHIEFESGERSPLHDPQVFETVVIKAPLYSIWRRSTFSQEVAIPVEGGDALLSLDFIPTRRVKLNTVYDLLDK